MAQVDGTVIIDSKINTAGAQAGTDNLKSMLKNTVDYMKILPQAFRDIPNIAKTAFSSASRSIKSLSPSVRNLQDEIDRYTEALYYAEKAGYSLGDAPYDKAYAGLQRARQEAEEYKKLIVSLNAPQAKINTPYDQMRSSFQQAKSVLSAFIKQLKRTDSEQKKVTKSNKKMNESIKDTSKSVGGVGTSIKTILKYTLGIRSLFVLFNRLRSGVTEGMQNLAQYSDSTNSALSLLMSRMTQLKNATATAFQPLVEFVAPALAKFISLLAEASTWTSQLFSALIGKDTYVKAVEVQQDYAESLDKSKDKTEELQKATEKSLAPFDKLIQLQKSSSKTPDSSDSTDKTLKPSQMFETEEVSQDMKSFADKVKETFSGLFDPLRQSWLENGPIVTEAVRNALAAIKQLASDVGASFMQVWNVEGYGKRITDDLLITFANLVQTVANLVTQFDRAWVSGNTGTNIIRHLGDIVLTVTGFFREASESIKNWAASLDFSPLLQAFDNVLVSVKPIVEDVGNVCLWFLNNVLLPIAKWAVEQSIPSVFNLIAAALNALHSVIEALKPLAMWLWEEYLQPLGEWTGEVIISALEQIVEWLTKFSDWVGKHQTTVQNITVAVLAFFAAWKFMEFVSGIALMVTAIGMISSALSVLGISLTDIMAKLALSALKFAALTAAITGIITVISILARNWNKMTPTEKMISGILAAASAVAVLAVALGAIKGVAGAAVVGAAIAAGIAAATIAIKAGERQVSSYQSSNASRISTKAPLTAYAAVPYQMPRLATGTVVPPGAGEFAAILGDNKRETEVVSPLSTMKQALIEALQEAGVTGNNQTVKATLEVDGTRFGQLIAKFGNQENQRVGVRLVTEGKS